MHRSACKVLKLHKERFDKDFKLSVIFTKLLDLRNFTQRPTDLKDSLTENLTAGKSVYRNEVGHCAGEETVIRFSQR